MIWDFSGYNTITIEKVAKDPQENQVTTMRWYRDPSHYTKLTGDLVLKTMLSYPQQQQDSPSDFGVLINPENIEYHLQQNRQ